MMTWELFRHYLLSRRAGALIRTVAWLCMAGVAIGVMSLVVVISVMNGFNDQIRRRLLAVEPHLVVKIPGLERAELLKTHPLYRDLSARKDIQTEIYENQDVILRTVDGLFGGAVARGVEPRALGYILRETRKALLAGRSERDSEKGSGENSGKNSGTDSEIETPPIADESVNLGPGEVLVGIDLARSLGIFEGDKIVIIPPEALLLPSGEAPPFERVTVRGLLTTNLPDIDAKAIFYGRGEGRGATLANLRRSASQEAGFELRVADPNDVGGLKAELEAKGAKVETWMERNSTMFYALRMEKIAMGSFLALSALIASFSIVTVLVLLLTQKRKDIGVLMSMGLSPRKTRLLFVRLGLWLSGIGIGGGMLLGVIICLIVDNYPLPILPDIYYDTTIPARLSPVFLAGILLASGAIAFVSAYFPARQATRESPAECLRSQRQIHEERR